MNRNRWPIPGKVCDICGDAHFTWDEYFFCLEQYKQEAKEKARKKKQKLDNIHNMFEKIASKSESR